MRVIAVLLFAFLVFGCNSKTKDSYSYINGIDEDSVSIDHPGKKLMETNCYVCHNPNTSHEDRIGPPMIAIKRHYVNDKTTKEAFIADMQSWIKNPNEDDAKMRGAVRRFGVMPKQYFPEESIEKIADYMFDNAIAQPEWFEDHFNQNMGKGKAQGKQDGKGKGKKNKQVSTRDFEDLPYGERGLKYALTTKAVLGKNLMGTIQKKGTLEALNFCSERAYPLTDSMGILLNATIKRVTDKPRNPKNLANTEELEYIKTFKQRLASNYEMEPIVNQSEDNVHVYYPIITNSMCLQCHGTPQKDILNDNYERILKLYPNDKAIGYSENEVRGTWQVTFDKN